MDGWSFRWKLLSPDPRTDLKMTRQKTSGDLCTSFLLCPSDGGLTACCQRVRNYLRARRGGRKQTDMALFSDRDVITSGRGQALSGAGLEYVPQEITHARASSQSQQKSQQPRPAVLPPLAGGGRGD